MALTHFYQYLDTNGNGTGTTNAIGNYATTADDFYYTATEYCYLNRLSLSIEDAGNFDADKYGNGIELTNGIQVLVELAGTEYRIDGGISIKNNANWARYCFEAEVKAWGIGNTFLIAQKFFEDLNGIPFVLEAGDKFIIRLNDDFTGLIGHRFLLQGHYAERDF